LDTFCVNDPLGESPLPEPVETGVEPTQKASGGDLVVLPPGEEKAYGSMASTLGAYSTGLRAAAIPILKYSAAQLEERIAELKTQRDLVSDKLSQCQDENKDQAIALAGFRARLATRPSATLAEQMLTTFGAAFLGAGLSTSDSRLAPVGIAVGIVLMVSGWSLAAFTLYRNREIK
jgi:hypothetical protein